MSVRAAIRALEETLRSLECRVVFLTDQRDGHITMAQDIDVRLLDIVSEINGVNMAIKTLKDQTS